MCVCHAGSYFLDSKIGNRKGDSTSCAALMFLRLQRLKKLFLTRFSKLNVKYIYQMYSDEEDQFAEPNDVLSVGAKSPKVRHPSNVLRKMYSQSTIDQVH